MNFLLRRQLHVVSIKFSQIFTVCGKWSGGDLVLPGESLYSSQAVCHVHKGSEQEAPLGMTLLPFLSEPLPWHFSRAASRAANTAGHRTKSSQTTDSYYILVFSNCHHSEVISSCVPKDAQGCNIQASIPQRTRMAGKGSSSPLGFRGWQIIVGLIRGFAVLRSLLKCVAPNLFPQYAVIGLAWENSWETSGTRARIKG